MVVKHLQLVELYIEEKKLVPPYPTNLHAIVKQMHRFEWKCRNPVCTNMIDLNSCRNKIRLFCSPACRQQFYTHRDRIDELKKKFEPRFCAFCGEVTPVTSRGYTKYCNYSCMNRFRNLKRKLLHEKHKKLIITVEYGLTN